MEAVSLCSISLALGEFAVVYDPNLLSAYGHIYFKAIDQIIRLQGFGCEVEL